MTRAPRPSRWWMAGVPAAIASMLATSAFRVNDLWYVTDQHHVTTEVDQGEWARTTFPFRDAHGQTTRTFEVRFAGWGDTTTDVEKRLGAGDRAPLPEGVVAREVKLDFRARPDQTLRNCVLTLVDDQGRIYRLGDLVGPLGEFDACVPKDTPGPDFAFSEGQKRGETPEGAEPRPAEWTVTPAIVVPKDATFVELRVSYENPDYLSIRLTR